MSTFGWVVMKFQALSAPPQTKFMDVQSVTLTDTRLLWYGKKLEDRRQVPQERFFFLWFLGRFMHIYSQWTSEIMLSSESVTVNLKIFVYVYMYASILRYDCCERWNVQCPVVCLLLAWNSWTDSGSRDEHLENKVTRSSSVHKASNRQTTGYEH